MIVHFVSEKEKRAACGAFYYPISRNSNRRTEDHVLVTCGSCRKVIEAAAKTGKMVFDK